MHEGTNAVKINKLQQLTTRFEVLECLMMNMKVQIACKTPMDV